MGSKASKNNSNEDIKSLDNLIKNGLESKELVNDCYSYFDSYNHSCCAFKSIDNIFYLIYATKEKSIIFMNLITTQKLNEAKEAHDEDILCFRHILDEINKKDFVMSVSSNSIKIWDINNNGECKQEIKEKYFYLSSACFLKDKNQLYIVTSHFESALKSKPISVFDLNGNKIKEINDSNEGKFYIEVYNKNSKNYIITANSGSSIAYDYSKNKIYNVYRDESTLYHKFLIPTKDNKLIISCEDQTIKVFNFSSGKLLIKIEEKYNNYDKFLGICLWNNEYIFAGGYGEIKLINIKTGEIVKKFSEDRPTTLQKIIHPEYGECLITQSQTKEKSSIHLWTIKNGNI